MEKKKRRKKYSRTDKVILGIGIYHSWCIRPFYSDTDYLCSACILLWIRLFLNNQGLSF